MQHIISPWINVNFNKLLSTDTDLKDFMNLYSVYIKEFYSFLVKTTTLPLHHPLRFRVNPMEKIILPQISK